INILPVLADRIAYIPIDYLHFEDDMYNLDIQNLVVKCSKILPSHIKILSSVEMDIDAHQFRGELRFSISKIQASARDAAFFYKKKKGLIKMKDVGLMDFEIYGNGLSLDITLV